jgi:hypothetical protein
MKHFSYRHFIATVAISAVAITGFSAAPARAGQDDLNKALAALAGLAVLGVVIHHVRDDDKKERRRVIDRRYDPYDPPISRPAHRRVDRKILPQHCLRSVDARDGRQHVFGRRCLKQNYNYVDSLPDRCKLRFRGNGEKRVGYGARCLHHAGYVLARH